MRRLDRQFITAGVIIVVGSIIALLITTSFAKSRSQNGADENLWNVYSKQCDAKQYAVYGTANASGTFLCEESIACRTDADCEYLEIDKLPPRIGSCVNGSCTATCGSGVIRQCK
jgi:hypothetical protein